MGKQFQGEPDIQDSLPTTKRVVNMDDKDDATIYNTNIFSVLIGLRLQGQMTDRDRQVLDDLAGDDALIFLIHQDRYVHPEGVEMFPATIVETTLAQASGAIFTQQYRTDNSIWLIHSAVINSGEVDPLVVGYFGQKEAMSKPSVANRFIQLVAQLRRDYKQSTTFVARLQESLVSDQPILIIDRDTNRIISANQAAEEVASCNENCLDGTDYREFRKKLLATDKHMSVSMQNLIHENCHFCIVGFGVTPDKETGESSCMTPHFVHKMRNKISSIYTAATHLETVASESMETDEAQLMSIIVEEVSDLNQQLDRFHLLLEYDRMPKETVNLKEEFDRAAHAVNTKMGSLNTATGVENLALFIQSGPADSWYFLFEAILNSHWGSRDAAATTNFSVFDTTTPGQAILTATTTWPVGAKEKSVDASWPAYATKLAHKLGVGLSEDSSRPDEFIVTELVLDRQQIGRISNQNHHDTSPRWTSNEMETPKHAIESFDARDQYEKVL